MESIRNFYRGEGSDFIKIYHDKTKNDRESGIYDEEAYREWLIEKRATDFNEHFGAAYDMDKIEKQIQKLLEH